MQASLSDRAPPEFATPTTQYFHPRDGAWESEPGRYIMGNQLSSVRKNLATSAALLNQMKASIPASFPPAPPSAPGTFHPPVLPGDEERKREEEKRREEAEVAA